MGTKINPGRFDCAANAEPDEEQFTLLARDPVAPLVIEVWCMMRALLVSIGIKPIEDLEMIAEARACAAQMHRWREANRPKLKVTL